AEQFKAIVWQLKGRRRFITELIQLCNTNMEMKKVLSLYYTLTKASHDVDGYSTYYQDRKEQAQSLSNIILKWIKDESVSVNPRIVVNILVFVLDRQLLDQVFQTLDNLRREGFVFSHKFFTTAVHRFGKEQKFDYMDLTLELMKRQG